MKRYTLVIAVVYDNPIEHWLFELNIELIGAYFYITGVMPSLLHTKG